MATAHTIQIAPDNTGLWQIQQSQDAAKRVTELLQEDFESHHCFFNQNGFHNHISHHVLALYGLGASPSELMQGYDDNKGYQRAMYKVHEDQIAELKDWEKAKAKMGKEEHYSDFLAFFQQEIDHKGWEEVLNEYMFKGDDRSEDMLIRMFAGFLHPLIQLMYGVEWKQPAIVAMALAQAAVHADYLRDFFQTSENTAKSAPTPMPRIASLLTEAASNKKMATSAQLADGNKIRDGVLARAWDETIEIAGQVRVLPEELEERTAEMYNTAIYEAAAAAVWPGKDAKYDFFLMHHVNVCPIFVAINQQSWISTENKVRLLEWKIRLDLVEYAARASPQLSVNKVASYVPRDKNPGPAIELLPRVNSLSDDGHVSKLFRAIGICREINKKYEDADWLQIKGDLWTKVAYMVIDGAETPGPKWVRGAGDPEAWKDVNDRTDSDNGRL
ncbi:HypA protein [Xylariaceae sp. FL0016]|nr:HypA protein [Xylariaceae sp. FL0016]